VGGSFFFPSVIFLISAFFILFYVSLCLRGGCLCPFFLRFFVFWEARRGTIFKKGRRNPYLNFLLGPKKGGGFLGWEEGHKGGGGRGGGGRGGGGRGGGKTGPTFPHEIRSLFINIKELAKPNLFSSLAGCKGKREGGWKKGKPWKKKLRRGGCLNFLMLCIFLLLFFYWFLVLCVLF